jgi:hypothetical protein
MLFMTIYLAPGVINRLRGAGNNQPGEDDADTTQ